MSQNNPDSLPDPVSVSVTEVRTEDGLVFQVDPAVLHVLPEQTVNFSYGGTVGATLFIPYAGVFSDRIFDFTRDGSCLTLSVTVSAKPPEDVTEFNYALYSRDKDGFAIGNSPPRMIIDPPNK